MMMKAIGKRSVSSFITMLLNVSWYALAAALVLAVCLAVFTPFMGLANYELEIPTSFSVDARDIHVNAPSLDIENALIQDARGSLVFAPPGTLAVFVPLVFVVLVLVFALWVLGELRAVFRTLRDGHPFVPVNATRIRRIGYAVIFAELVRFIAVFSSNYYVMTHFSAQGLHFNARSAFNGFAIVYGLIILVIAEVFTAGTRLDEEQSLTI